NYKKNVYDPDLKCKVKEEVVLSKDTKKEEADLLVIKAVKKILFGEEEYKKIKKQKLMIQDIIPLLQSLKTKNSIKEKKGKRNIKTSDEEEKKEVERNNKRQKKEESKKRKILF
ncbi:41242_t:CDS:2, partial [Gigaspora margarita]